MYEAFFGLHEKPFALTPNTGFLVQLAPYQACLNLACPVIKKRSKCY